MKKAIALAVAAALAAPLAAQAEVKISGQMQAEITSWGGDRETGITMNDAQEGGNPDSGNFGALNFSASEDLGNGMKALAKIGMNVNAPSGTSNGNRDAYIGLSGGFGTVLAGTMSTPYKMATVKWDPFLASSAQARGNGAASTLHNGYASNVLAYANKFGNAKFVAAVAVDESTDTGDYDNENTLTASLNVPVGPVEIALGYLSNGAANADDGAAATKVGIKYAAGAVSVAVVAESLEAGITGGTNGYWGDALGTADSDESVVTLHATYTMGANTFALTYGQTDLDDTDIDVVNASAGVVHSFSKKTSAHIAYTNVNVNGMPDFDVSGVAAGLRVKF